MWTIPSLHVVSKIAPVYVADDKFSSSTGINE